MLETPTFGRFSGEDRYLVFGPPSEYDGLMNACIVGGSAAALYGFLAGALQMSVPFANPSWWFFVGLAVAVAGGWAHLSVVRIKFTLGERHYARRQGPGIIPRLSRGKFDAIDALVVIAEKNSVGPMMMGAVKYHMVLHWKAGIEPPMVLETTTVALPSSAMPNAASGAILARAQRFAKALQIPLYDNTHFFSPCPIPIWK